MICFNSNNIENLDIYDGNPLKETYYSSYQTVELEWLCHLVELSWIEKGQR